MPHRAIAYVSPQRANDLDANPRPGRLASVIGPGGLETATPTAPTPIAWSWDIGPRPDLDWGTAEGGAE